MNNLIDQLKEALVPKGYLPVVRIFVKDNSKYYNQEFIDSCIKELERKIFLVQCEMDEFTPLERLACDVLFDSAYIKVGE